jgi:hypothetical protein
VLEVTESPDGVNRLSQRTIGTVERIRQKYELTRLSEATRSKLEGQLYYLEGSARLLTGDVSGARKSLRIAMQRDPLRAKLLLAFLASLAGPSTYVVARKSLARLQRRKL